MTVSQDKIKDIETRLRDLGVSTDDLVEKFVRGSGPGGQKINKTSIAVYLRHKPTGIEIKVQQSRSQADNRFVARRKLVEKLEALQEQTRSIEEQRVAKIRRQKRKRSKRAKEKLLADKKHQAEKKKQRKPVRTLRTL